VIEIRFTTETRSHGESLGLKMRA